MRRGSIAVALSVMAIGVCSGRQTTSAQARGAGTIRGHVRLIGPLPGNAVIRMGMDPMCTEANAGTRVTQDVVLASRDGSLANVLVQLKGTFPATPVATTPVLIDQRGCVYVPRVVGVRIGQPLQVRNSDGLMHNVHALSAVENGFNVSQPSAGMMREFRLTREETMLRLRCDIHGWMTAFIGVIAHPYFAVSDRVGSFEIANVPIGQYSIQAWHERYGSTSQSIGVHAGATSTVEFTYGANQVRPGVLFRSIDATSRRDLLALEGGPRDPVEPGVRAPEDGAR